MYKKLNKNHRQFITLYNENKDSLFNHLMYRLNFQQQLAEDMFMDIIYKAYEHFDSFDPKKASFKTWIFTIARNSLANHWRDSKEVASLEKLQEQGFEPAIHESFDDVDKSYDGAKIAKVLSLLSDEEREIIELRFLQEMEFEEISVLISKSNGAIRTQLSRALKRFKEHYTKLYPHTP